MDFALPSEPDLEDAELSDGLQTTPEPELRRCVVPPTGHGLRLDRMLVDAVPEFSRSYLQQLIEAGCVQVNGQLAVKSSSKLRLGDQLQVELRPTQQSQAFKPEAMSLDVVYQDEYLLVLNKPAGLVVHPAPGHWSGTLLNGLLAHDVKAAQLPRAGIVHRLDKDTSGLMVVARTRSTMDALVQAIAARTVRRQYLALAHGMWGAVEERWVDAPVGRDPRNRLRMAVVDLARHPGKAAQTQIRLLSDQLGACLVECTLQTGRTHQIRVHMASLGHPLLADVLYGGQPTAGLTRQALHAYKLAFQHPVTGEPLFWSVPLPPDLAQTAQLLGLSYNLA